MDKIKKVLLFTENNESVELDYQQFREKLVSDILNSIDSAINQTIAPDKNEPQQEECVPKKNLKTRDKILLLIAENKHITAKALAQRVCVTEKAIEKQLANLKAEGIIKRQGCNKGGHWLIIKGE